jgi:hypothetical protein
MEPLLRGESSGLRHRSRGIVRRTDAITYGSKYEKAAALIDLVRSIHSPFPFSEVNSMNLSFYSVL